MMIDKQGRKIITFINILLLFTPVFTNAQPLTNTEIKECGVLYTGTYIPVSIVRLGKFDGIKTGDRVAVDCIGYMTITMVQDRISYAVPEFLEREPGIGERVKLHTGFTYEQLLEYIKKRFPINEIDPIICYGEIGVCLDRIGHAKIRDILNELLEKVGNTEGRFSNAFPSDLKEPEVLIYTTYDILGLFWKERPPFSSDVGIRIHKLQSFIFTDNDIEILIQIMRTYLRKFEATVIRDSTFTNLKAMVTREIRPGSPIKIIQCDKNLVKIRTLLGAEGWIPLQNIESSRNYELDKLFIQDVKERFKEIGANTYQACEVEQTEDFKKLKMPTTLEDNEFLITVGIDPTSSDAPIVLAIRSVIAITEKLPPELIRADRSYSRDIIDYSFTSSLANKLDINFSLDEETYIIHYDGESLGIKDVILRVLDLYHKKRYRR